MTDGINITEILSTPRVQSASDLLDFFKIRTNQFFSKKMLLDEHGFSANIGKNLTTLTTRNIEDSDRLWRMSSRDLKNKRNKKQQNYYALVDKSTLSKEQLLNLMERCMIITPASTPAPAPVKTASTPIKKSTKKLPAKK